MRKEAQARILRPEFGRNQSIRVEAVTVVDFSSGSNRGVIEIVHIGSSSARLLELVHPQQELSSNISEFPKIMKPEITPIEEAKKPYNPGKRAKSFIDENGRRIVRIRRKSRCDGVHDAQENPCGSPRCRTKTGVQLEKKQNTGKEKNTTVKSKDRRTRTLLIGRKVS